APLNDGVFVLLVDASVNDRVAIAQLELAHFAVAVKRVAGLKLLGGEETVPIAFQLAEPELKGLRGIDSFRAVGLHPTKKSNVDSGRGWATLICPPAPAPARSPAKSAATHPCWRGASRCPRRPCAPAPPRRRATPAPPPRAPPRPPRDGPRRPPATRPRSCENSPCPARATPPD